MADKDFIYKLNGVGNSSTGGQYSLDNPSQTLSDEDVNDLIASALRTMTQRQVIAGGSSQSQNFVTGSSGWQIDGQGNAEFNNGTFRGTFKIGGTLITVTAIANLQTAINTVSTAGGGTVALVPATYNATTSFTIPSNVTVDGNGATIDFGGGAYQFSAIGTSAYSTGTLAVNFGSGSVTGTGTTWTAGMIGQSILIGDYWYTIATRTSNTAITITPVFRAPNVSGVTYVIATTVNTIGLKNITLQNNITNPLWDFRYVNGLVMDSLLTITSPQGIRGRDSATVDWRNSSILTCTAGIIFNNVPFSVIDNCGILDISGGTGIDLIAVTNSTVGVISIQNVTGVGIKFTSCGNTAFDVFSIIECTSHGVEFVSGNSPVDIFSGYVDTCGGDGIKLTATSNKITLYDNTVINCTGYGINIANANCNNTIVASSIFANNTAGNLNDLGTSTKIRGNQGVSDNIVEGDLSLTNITTNDASTSKHGFMKKLPNDATKFYDGTGAFSTPSSGGYSSGIITRDPSATDGAVTTAHGLGTTPKRIKITMDWGTFSNANAGKHSYSSGVYDGTTNNSIVNYFDNGNSNTAVSSTTKIVQIWTSASNHDDAVATFDATNITLTWTKTGGTASDLAVLLWEAWS